MRNDCLETNPIKKIWAHSYLVKGEMQPGHPKNWCGAGAGRIEGAISVARTLIHLIPNTEIT